MIYREAIEYMKQIQVGAKIKPGLEVTRTLMQHLGNPQDRLSFVHVAGTNGKGSTAAFISEICAGQGMKVGRYVSPSVFSEREKIQYRQGSDTVYITEEEMADAITQIREGIEKMQERGEGIPTEFEIETAAAFLTFARWDCDLVVLETGMGGRLDATNIITTTVCAVITPIALDHMKYLGNTIEEIAAHKAGIIKRQVPVVTCQHDPAAEDGIIRTCETMSCPWHAVARDDIRIRASSLAGTRFDYRQYKDLGIRMSGRYQVENACLAIECVEMIRKGISAEQIRRGLWQASWRGRFEVIHEDPAVIVDGAHNPDGLKSFLESVDAYFQTEKKVAVMGVFADKDHKEMAGLVGDTFSRVYTVSPGSGRALSADVLADEINQSAGEEIAMPCGSLREAFRFAEQDGGDIFIFGSLSLLKDACEYWPSGG